MLDFQTFAQIAGSWLDALGVTLILAGILFSTIVLAITAVQSKSVHHLYRSYRHNLARSILIGLEFLVAGDIIRSVAGNLSFDSVGVLAIIVVIRSVISMEFEMEIEGRWPWTRAKAKSS